MTPAHDSIQALYKASSTPQSVVVPELRYLMIDGQGDPNTSAAYAEALQALYGVSYGARFAVKKAGGEVFKVSPLEGLWWSPDPEVFLTGDRSQWLWTMMIRQPDSVTADLVADLMEQVATKKAIPAARQLRLETLAEGTAAQVLYLGPYTGEGPTIQGLHDFIHQNGCQLDGKHHEIYLGDPRRTAPEKLRTILRQPYRA